MYENTSKEYLLIAVIDNNISVHRFRNLGLAREKMRKDWIMCIGDDDCDTKILKGEACLNDKWDSDIHEAWIKNGEGNSNYNWKIIRA